MEYIITFYNVYILHILSRIFEKTIDFIFYENNLLCASRNDTTSSLELFEVFEFQASVSYDRFVYVIQFFFVLNIMNI